MSALSRRVLENLGPALRQAASAGIAPPFEQDLSDPTLLVPDDRLRPDPTDPDLYQLDGLELAEDPTMPGTYQLPAGGPLDALVDALTAGAERADQLLTTTAGGWLAAFDLDGTPEPSWLGLVTGTRVPGGLTVAEQRAYVAGRPAWRRGTLGALREAALAQLTGGKRLEIVERDGSPWRLTVRVYQAEVPDPSALRAALLEQKPVGIVLNLDVRLGASFQHMRTQHGPTFAAARVAFPTFRDAKTHLPEGAS